VAFDFSTLGPLIAAAETAGLPIAENLLKMALTPYTGPFAGMIVSAVDVLIRGMNAALGLPLDAPPDQTAAKIMDDPSDASAKLQEVEANNAHVLDMAKAGMDFDLQAQAQQTALIIEDGKTEGFWAHIYQAGWRPFTAWGLVFQLGVMMVAPDVVWLVEVTSGRVLTPFPQTNFELIVSMLLALLGLGTMRTVEKRAGVAPGQTIKAVPVSAVAAKPAVKASR
jgi:hypothetical protein